MYVDRFGCVVDLLSCCHAQESDIYTDAHIRLHSMVCKLSFFSFSGMHVANGYDNFKQKLFPGVSSRMVNDFMNFSIHQ